MNRELVEGAVLNQVVAGEWEGSSPTAYARAADFTDYLGLIDSTRDLKEYDWMSNIRIPEFASQMLTQSSIDVEQYFKTREFVEVYVEDKSEEALVAAKAAKVLVNKTLNQRTLKHYPKFVRAKLINHLAGSVYALAHWEQEIVQKELRGERIDVVKRDHFNYDILDPRNVRVSPEYRYSVQDKDWVMLEDEKTLSELQANAEELGYFNLDKVEEFEAKGSEEVAAATAEIGKPAPFYPILDPKYRVIYRYGKFWAIVDERDEEYDYPTKVSLGVDEEGKPLENAELVECLLTIVTNETSNVLIGFEPAKFISANGEPYRPILRGVCYIHPVDDEGFGDGRYGRDLQTAIDDTYNLGNDRTRLATMPTFKGSKNAMLDNDTVFFEPEHVIELDNINDLQEIPISDNINGSLEQMQFLVGKLNQVMAMFPTTMGALPAYSSTTATAVAGAESRTDIRTNYKSMSFEYTFLVDLYWMIQQMTFAYATEPTAKKLLGEYLYDFNPELDYWYKPISQTIESEYSKKTKINTLLQILSYITQSGHPDAVKMFNYLIGQILELMGQEAANFGDKFFREGVGLASSGQGEPIPGQPVSNQSGIPQSGVEQVARGTV